MKFSIKQIISDVIYELNMKRYVLLQALLFPALAIITLDLFASFYTTSGFIVLVYKLFNAAFYALFAVSCHRIILLGKNHIPNKWGIYFSSTVGSYIWYLILIAIIEVIVTLFIGLIFIPLSGFVPFEGVYIDTALFIIFTLPLFYVAARISLILPSTAIDKDQEFSDIWKLSEGNGWKLTVALALPPTLALIIAWPIGALGNLVDNFISSFFTMMIFCILGAVEVSALSCSYRALACQPDVGKETMEILG